jgi:guanylate kinase
MAEWAEVHGNYYGTSLGFIRDRLQNGFDILLDIDVQGAESIRKAYPGAITVFIRPPSLETLRERLTRRGTDSPDVIETRIGNAVKEMDQMSRFDHVIVNDDLEIAKQELFGIVRTGR